MSATDQTGTPQRVAVTGASGFIASELVAQLLAQGFEVVGSVRDPDDEHKVAPLRRLAAEHENRLTLVAADLLQEGSFDPVFAGASTVFHVASPFRMPEKIDDGYNEMVRPALEGTRNVLASVNRTESVRTVVMTSTVGAIFGDYIDVYSMSDRTLSERYFNTTSTVENNPYHYSKTLAEQEAWKIASKQRRWRLATINPGLVIGPSLTSASESGSLFLLDELLKGEFFYGAANLSFTLVDVRDVALAHIEAAIRQRASGRYILALDRMYSFLEMARIVRPVHRRPWLLPRWQIPDAAVRVIGPRFGLTQDFIAKHLGIRFAVDNHRSIAELGMAYRPVEQTLRDHVVSWQQRRERR